MVKSDIAAFRKSYLANNQASQRNVGKGSLEAQLFAIREQHAHSESQIRRLEAELAHSKAELAAVEEIRVRLGEKRLDEQVELEAQLWFLVSRLANRELLMAPTELEIQKLEALVAGMPDFAVIEVAVEQGLEKLLADLDDDASKLSRRLADISTESSFSRPSRKVQWAQEVMQISADAFEAVVEAAKEQEQLARMYSSLEKATQPRAGSAQKGKTKTARQSEVASKALL